MYYLCTMCIGLWPAAPKNLKKWPMANFELETPVIKYAATAQVTNLLPSTYSLYLHSCS